MSAAADRLTAALADRYRIERELGEGGMATVYLAEDLKHHREVAIKVLKPELAAVLGAERFVQEIATTAALQHPNILPLFDSGEADGFLYYVMPYVEGESLRDKLDREQQLGVEEAVALVREVADGLQYAHEHGVVHRDIKPENILIHAGRPMVADFGIALAVSAAAGGRMTETGLSLGTPHYMSPEQATAEKTITNRSDVYSLASVLYEMLTGDPPHTGKTAQQIIMKIVTEEPAPVTKVRHSVPPNVSAALSHALEKLPADRFESAKAFADALADPHFTTGAPREGGDAPRRARSWVRDPRSLAVSGVAVLAVAALLWSMSERPSAAGTAPPRQVRFTVPVSADTGVYLGGVVNAAEGRPASTAIALSPDGTLLVYAGWRRGPDGNVTSQLYRRPLDQDHAEPIAGTDSASCPFFSPDGKWIAFFTAGSLRRVPAAGGNVETIVVDDRLSSARPPWGAAWGADGTIFYSVQDRVYRVPATGGEPTVVLSVAPDSSRAGSAGAPQGFAQPEPLPGGRTLLLQRRPDPNPRHDEIIALDLASGKLTTLLTDASDPRYVLPGRLLFMRRGTLMEVGFDPARLRLEGQPRAVLQDIMQATFMASYFWDDNDGQVAISRAGDVAYVPGGVYPEVPETVERVALDGHATPLGWAARTYYEPRVSPDSDRVAYAAGHGGDLGMYVRDLSRGVTLRLNTGAYTVENPVWSPDGRSIAFMVETGAVYTMNRIAADNSGPPERLVPSRYSEWPASWSSRGVLAFLRSSRGKSSSGSDGRFDIWTLPPGGKPEPFVATEAHEEYPTFSPDGSEIAYTSDESGRTEVYVRPYPGPGPAVPVSSGGGIAPAWSPHGRRLYYLQPRTGRAPAMMVADVVSRDPFRVGRPRTLIDPWPYRTNSPLRNYDVLPDGSFLAVRIEEPRGGSGSYGLGPLRELYHVRDIKVILNFLGTTGGATP